jgi:enoyl-CoA hydratase/carnithine racemase
MTPTEATATNENNPTTKVLVEQDGPVLRIALNRPEKANALDADVVAELSHALTLLSDDPGRRVAVIHSHGKHFTSGLDLAFLAPRLATGDDCTGPRPASPSSQPFTDAASPRASNSFSTARYASPPRTLSSGSRR